MCTYFCLHSSIWGYLSIYLSTYGKALLVSYEKLWPSRLWRHNTCTHLGTNMLVHAHVLFFLLFSFFILEYNSTMLYGSL